MLLKISPPFKSLINFQVYNNKEYIGQSKTGAGNGYSFLSSDLIFLKDLEYMFSQYIIYEARFAMSNNVNTVESKIIHVLQSLNT